MPIFVCYSCHQLVGWLQGWNTDLSFPIRSCGKPRASCFDLTYCDLFRRTSLLFCTVKRSRHVSLSFLSALDLLPEMSRHLPQELLQRAKRLSEMRANRQTQAALNSCGR